MTGSTMGHDIWSTGMRGCGKKETNKQPFLEDPIYKCFYANAQSIQAKMGLLELLVARDNIDIAAIMETWWYLENQWDTTIPGYKLYRMHSWRWDGHLCQRRDGIQ